MKAKKAKAPWKKPAPKKSRHTTLNSADKARAKRAAKRGGRSYPNLVDNMRIAAARKKKKKK